ncbi:PLP-dependent aminotransferase family protein [Serratia ureilytica]
MALGDDIIEGKLQGGDRLPAHRTLAWQLEIGLGTVTKAYAILERRGLVRSVKGRGMFVAIRHAREKREIDLSSNAPPAVLTDRLLARTLASIARKMDADHLNLYSPPTGHLEHRRLLARWLENVGVTIEPSNLALTSNARQAISLAFDLACGPRGTILTERISYPGAIALARRKGHCLIGIDIDAQGMVPQALSRALERVSCGHTAVYLTPTLHNPTTATMSAERRQTIVEICRQANVWIIEDGVYAWAFSNACARDIGTRAGVPCQWPVENARPGIADRYADSAARHAKRGGRSLARYSLRAFATVLRSGGEWLSSGAVEAIPQALRHEAQRRVHLATSIFDAGECVSHPDAYHVWLPMPRETAESVAAAAALANVKVTPPDAVMVNRDERATGIRLCLVPLRWTS